MCMCVITISILQVPIGEGLDAGRREDIKDGSSRSQMDKLENTQEVRIAMFNPQMGPDACMHSLCNNNYSVEFS